MKQFGLIGRTLKHSFSKAYFTEKFQREQRTDCVYENFELDTIGAFPFLLEQHPNLLGLNVTIPYKQAVLPFLDETDHAVGVINACNCIRIRNSRTTGFNTDHIGFRESLRPMLKPQHNNALVLGNGGAAQAVLLALAQLSISVTVVSRNKGDGLNYDDLTSGIIDAHPLIINTTPLGTWPDIHSLPALPYDAVGPHHILYDLVYNPELTAFLQQGKERGAVIKNGHEMLLLQAEAAWEIWNK